MKRDKLVYGRTTEEIEAEAREILEARELTISTYLHQCLVRLVKSASKEKEK